MKIKDIGKIVTGKTPSTKNENNFNGDILFITPSDITCGSYIGNTSRTISEQGFKAIKTNTISGYSILVGCIGSVGNVAWTDKTCATNQQINSITEINSDINPLYIYYYLSTKKELLQKLAGTTTTPILPKSVFEEIDITIPEKYIQDKIGDVLKSIDDKISTNNRINAELESMAKTIYDYWFTQFDFPDENGKPYKSSGGKMVWNEELKREIPEGWGVVSFSDLISFEKGKIPEQLFEDKASISFSPYLTIDVVNGGQSQYCATDKMPYCNGETIMVMDGAASGDVYVGNKGVLGSTFAMLKPKNQSYSNAMIYRMLKNHEIIYKKANTGSTVPHANRKFIEAMRIAVPTNIELFSKTFDTIQAKIEKCKEENQQLASLRDWLLPMLMNGQVGFEGE